MSISYKSAPVESFERKLTVFDENNFLHIVIPFLFILLIFPYCFLPLGNAVDEHIYLFFCGKREKLILSGLFLTSSLSPIFLSTEL